MTFKTNTGEVWFVFYIWKRGQVDYLHSVAHLCVFIILKCKFRLYKRTGIHFNRSYTHLICLVYLNEEMVFVI